MRRLLLLAVLGFALTLAIATAAAEAATGTIDPTAKLSVDHTTATVTGTLSCNPPYPGQGC